MSKYNVYLAGPWFHGNQPEILDKVEKCLDDFGEDNLKVFSPRRETLVKPDAQEDARRQSFLGNVRHVKASDFVVALVDDSDKGTLFECGIAYATEVPILYYSEKAESTPFNLMLAESCEKLGYVTNVNQLQERITEILSKGLDNMKAKRFEGEIE